jgi:hypothetical protein
VLLLSASTAAGGEAEGDCVSDAMKASGLLANRVRAGSETKPFDRLHAMYLAYGRLCDDGAPAEGMADATVAVIAFNWKQITKLFVLMDKNPDFGTFVVRHVDGPATISELKTILRSAEERCPKGHEGRCNELAAAAKEAIQFVQRGY